jgi:hypothetical protein
MGSEIPLLIRPVGKKALLDHDDASIDVVAVTEANDGPTGSGFLRSMRTGSVPTAERD